jgi:hypothetical protein
VFHRYKQNKNAYLIHISCECAQKIFLIFHAIDKTKQITSLRNFMTFCFYDDVFFFFFIIKSRSIFPNEIIIKIIIIIIIEFNLKKFNKIEIALDKYETKSF